MTYTLHRHTQLADLVTPVGIYLQLRQRYAQVLLLESSDYSQRENSSSFLAFDVLDTCQVNKDDLLKRQESEQHICQPAELITDFLHGIDIQGESSSEDAVFGYSSYELASEYEGYALDHEKSTDDLPLLRYDFYRYVLQIDHYRNQMELREYVPAGESSQMKQILGYIHRQDAQGFQFSATGDEQATMSDTDFLTYVDRARAHCQRGDVFQMVISRRYSQGFSGDEFEVYRALRSVNPSPYLFYFDYGTYKIFGSSPEAQLIINDGQAEIHPIAGTFKRTGDTTKDRLRAEALLADPKENAEHTMLVDLARNDLSRHCDHVTVSRYKEIQYFSHVIHLVSRVEGRIINRDDSFQVFGDSFPAGTLSGAPKYRALELIQEYEPHHRGFYGGAIGMIHLNGNFNHAIIIRSFLSNGGRLHYQAGAGIVIDSDPATELQEVHNKLAALRKAISIASERKKDTHKSMALHS